MAFEVLTTEDFQEWWSDLNIDQREEVMARVALLETEGPSLGRPVVDRVKGSQFHHMKELRCSSSGSLRVLFAFDPNRRAILLVGGDKSGRWRQWYRAAIPRADELYQQHLNRLKTEGET